MTVKMVDLAKLPEVERQAIAKGSINLMPETIEAIKNSRVKKGEVLPAAQIAGIHGVKATCNLIPMCHQIPLTFTDIRFDLRNERIDCICEVHAKYKTGVEMEALIGVTTSLLTIWDMVKYMEKDEEGNYRGTKITDLSVESKIIGEQQ
jgi:cyclic pyranopterin phosphate synthase